MWIRFILRLAREIFSYETLGWVMLNVLKDDGATLAFVNFVPRVFDESARNGIVFSTRNGRRRWLIRRPCVSAVAVGSTVCFSHFITAVWNVICVPIRGRRRR